MEWLTGNSFFVVLLLVCVGMHLFGHGHRHNHRSGDNKTPSNDDSVDRYRRKI